MEKEQFTKGLGWTREAMNKPYRGIIHLHTRNSIDSSISFRSILKVAREYDLNFLIVTDHDSISGSLRLRELVAKRRLDIEIPLAAEYKTNKGDVIAAFIRDEVHATTFEALANRVRAQEGILLLPHPWISHIDVEELAREVDMIEVFNARYSKLHDVRAWQLAKNYGKVAFYGSDAHTGRSLANVIVEVSREEDLKSSLLAGQMKCVKADKATRLDRIQSMYLKAIRSHDAKATYRLSRALLSRAFSRSWGCGSV